LRRIDHHRLVRRASDPARQRGLGAMLGVDVEGGGGLIFGYATLDAPAIQSGIERVATAITALREPARGEPAHAV
jgi:hypothetical protein